MNAALDNSRAVVAMQKNPYFLRAAGYIIKPALIPNAVRTFDSVCLESEHQAYRETHHRETCKHPWILLKGVNLGQFKAFQFRRCKWSVYGSRTVTMLIFCSQDCLLWPIPIQDSDYEKFRRSNRDHALRWWTKIRVARRSKLVRLLRSWVSPARDRSHE